MLTVNSSYLQRPASFSSKPGSSSTIYSGLSPSTGSCLEPIKINHCGCPCQITHKRRTIFSSLVQSFFYTADCTTQRFDHKDTSPIDQNVVLLDSLPGVRVKPARSTDQTPGARLSEYEINHWLDRETGWDRVRMMYAMKNGTFIHEDTRQLNQMFTRTMGLGATAILISSILTQMTEKGAKHVSATNAIIKGLSYETSTLKRITYEPLKLALKLTVFSVCLIYLSQSIAAYRNTSSVWEYTISSSLAFGLSSLDTGMKRFARSSLSGALVGTVGGYFISNFLDQYGVSQDQRHLEHVRNHLQQQRQLDQPSSF